MARTHKAAAAASRKPGGAASAILPKGDSTKSFKFGTKSLAGGGGAASPRTVKGTSSVSRFVYGPQGASKIKPRPNGGTFVQKGTVAEGTEFKPNTAPKPGTGTRTAFTNRAQPVPNSKSWSDYGKMGVSGGRKVIGEGVKTSGKALPALILGTFVIVLLAKVRGGKNIDGTKALLGGVFLWFFLTMLALWSPTLATLFAALVFTGALLEFGPTVFGGLFSGKTTPLPNIFLTGDGLRDVPADYGMTEGGKEWNAMTKAEQAKYPGGVFQYLNPDLYDKNGKPKN